MLGLIRNIGLSKDKTYAVCRVQFRNNTRFLNRILLAFICLIILERFVKCI